MRSPLDAVRAHAGSSIALFDYEEARRKRTSEYKKDEAIVDEDGFALSRDTAYGKTLGGGGVFAAKRFQEMGETTTKKKKKKAVEKEAFYAFQTHEKKGQELIELNKKWQRDWRRSRN